jgi:hypothetical protein
MAAIGWKLQNGYPSNQFGGAYKRYEGWNHHMRENQNDLYSNYYFLFSKLVTTDFDLLPRVSEIKLYIQSESGHKMLKVVKFEDIKCSLFQPAIINP